MSLLQLIFVGILLNVFLVLFPDFFSPLLTISMAPVITGMTKQFLFHFRLISVLGFLYFNCGCTFLSDGILCILLLLLLYYSNSHDSSVGIPTRVRAGRSGF
jgi:hypothetical protein